MRLQRLLACCALLLTCAASTGARAEQSELARAEQVFTEGKDFERALTLFRDSYASSPSWRALNGAALCLEELGRHVQALLTYEQLLAKHSEELGAKRVERLQARIRSASARVAQVHLETSQPKVRVTIDGEPVLTTAGALSVWLEPGAHAIEASGEGLDPYAATLRLEPGERQRVNIRLAEREPSGSTSLSGPATPLAAPRAAPPPNPGPRPAADQGSPTGVAAWIPWTVLGGGVVLLGVGGGLLLQSSADFDDFDASVDRGATGTSLGNPGDPSLLSRAETEQTLGVVSLVAAGAALSVSFVLFSLPGESRAQISLSPQGAFAHGRF